MNGLQSLLLLAAIATVVGVAFLQVYLYDKNRPRPTPDQIARWVEEGRSEETADLATAEAQWGRVVTPPVEGRRYEVLLPDGSVWVTTDDIAVAAAHAHYAAKLVRVVDRYAAPGCPRCGDRREPYEFREKNALGTVGRHWLDCPGCHLITER